MVPLQIEHELIATLTVVAGGPNLFTQSHLDLLVNVARPTAIAISNALAHEELLRYHALFMYENRFLKSDTFEVALENIIGADRGMRQVVEMVKQVAPLNNTVLLLGETGTGKELIANAIHFSSVRSDGPFIKVNCGAIPESLIDSELFGYEKGAFTGATGMRAGYFERADHGTIFLDEIGELPLQAQVRLLRILQTREVQRIGGARSIPVDIRIIAATHRNLESMVSQRTFREDLWFRINTFPLTIPPLRQRQEDIPALTRHFVERKSLEMRLGTPPQIAPDVLKRLIEYHWPGNVRELENIVERELIRYRGGLLSFDTLVPSRMGEALMLEEKAPLPPSCTKLDDATRAHIQWVLGMAGGKIHGPGGAAELLGIKPTTLRDRMDKLGITFRRQA
jgi:transcriptional regulator with GAF, ATPase, and Fis domain